MRLSRPGLFSPTILDCDPWDLPCESLNDQLKSEISLDAQVQTLAIGSALILPQSFGYFYP